MKNSSRRAPYFTPTTTLSTRGLFIYFQHYPSSPRRWQAGGAVGNILGATVAGVEAGVEAEVAVATETKTEIGIAIGIAIGIETAIGAGTGIGIWTPVGDGADGPPSTGGTPVVLGGAVAEAEAAMAGGLGRVEAEEVAPMRRLLGWIQGVSFSTGIISPFL